MKLLQVMKRNAALELLRQEFAGRSQAAGQEWLGIEAAIGRQLATDVYAPENMPQFKRSTVDGYAVNAVDITGCSESIPAFLRVTGDAIMGKNTSVALRPGQAVRIPTGGMLPTNADAVVMLEFTELMDSELAIFAPVAPRDNIIDIGDDIRVGEKLFGKGHRLEAHHIGVLGMLGISRVLVQKPPAIGIISTGDELVALDSQPAPGQVRDINALNLAVFARKYGCNVLLQQHVRDNRDEFRKELSAALSVCDLVLISGGSSVGEQDCTADIINDLGKPGVLVHGIAIKPGKPTIAARIGNKAVFGMPGHPTACVMAFLAVVAPFINEILLDNHLPLDSQKNCIAARSGFQLRCGQGREVFQLVKIVGEADGNIAYPLHGKSGMLSALAQADGYIEIPLDKEGLAIGEAVTVKLF